MYSIVLYILAIELLVYGCHLPYRCVINTHKNSLNLPSYKRYFLCNDSYTYHLNSHNGSNGIGNIKRLHLLRSSLLTSQVYDNGECSFNRQVGNLSTRKIASQSFENSSSSARVWECEQLAIDSQVRRNDSWVV